jgi:hypothetical protein
VEFYLYHPDRLYKKLGSKEEHKQAEANMADLGISHTHADQYGSARSKKPATARSRIHLAVNAALVVAAFVFLAAMVCGIIG